IFLQGEIEMTNQRIETLYYYWNGAAAAPNTNDWVIYMGHTDRNSFASTSDWLPLGELIQVFDGQLNLTNTPGWVEIVLQIPFVYNNSQNLVIAVDENTPYYDGSVPFFFSTLSPGQNRSLRFYDDSINPDPASPPTGNLVQAYPNIKLQFGSTAPYSISGRVVRNAIPAIGIADATVSLMGNETHNGITDANGFFSFTGLEGEQDYTWEISHAGYIRKYGSLNNINVDYDMGEIALDTILPYFDMGLVNSYLPNDQTYQGKQNVPVGISGDRSFNVYYNQNEPYPTCIPKYHIINENLDSSTPVNLFAQAPNNIIAPRIHSDGNAIYIAGLYNSSGRDPVHYEKYDIAAGTMTYMGSQSSWPTGAFSDIGLRAMLKAANGRIYMLSCWHYNGWEYDPADIYIRYSTNEMASWSNWIQGAHIDGEGLVYDSYMMEGSDGFIHLILWTNWGNQNKIAYFKFDQSTDSFVQRSILGLGKNPALYIDETTGRMAALYLNPQGKVICRYSDLADTQNWTDEEIVLENAGGIYGTGNSSVNGPYDLGHHYYLWNSTSSRQLLQWNGIDFWAKHEELPTTYLGKEYESARIYRSESGKLQIMQGYKDSGIAQYYNHLEIVSAEDAAYPYPSVSGLLATCGGMEVHLSWQASGNPQSYKIYRDKALIGESNTPGFADYDVTAMERYNYYVCAVYADGISKPSETINVLIPSLSGVSAYHFSRFMDSYEELTGATILGTSNNDNESFNDLPLGFSFTYNGQIYNRISVQTNGFIAFGSTVENTSLPISSASGTNNVLSAFTRDLMGKDNSSLAYKLSGVQPNRVFTIQWKNYRRKPSTCANDEINFQIQLHENESIIRFVYGNMNLVTVATAATVQVGLRGSDNTDYANRTTTADWLNTSPGTANNASCTINANVYPRNGLCFQYALSDQELLLPPTNLVASVSDPNVHLSWTAPGGSIPSNPDGFADDFESYQDFALEFEPWVLVDVDQSATYGFSGYSWPNVYSAMAYMVFNPSATTPPLTSIDAHSGSKMAASFASTDAVNNDWMMSPLVSVEAGQSLSFWARSYVADYGLERFKVGVSSGGTAPADFTIISGTSYIQAPVDWTEYTYDLTAYAGQDIRIGINCVSDDAFFFLVDDVSIGAAPAKFAFNPVTNYPSVSHNRSTGIAVPAPRALTRDLLGYKVYRDGDLISTINSGAITTYDDLGLELGTYSYTVTAFYDGGESEPAGPVTATILHLPAPLDLAATVDGNDVTLEWTSPEPPLTGEWITWCNPDVLGNS
ncbi:MAG: choice-of-anchor J domain-containing protein, partial [Candidatus Cloacimonadaceae bacterium]